ncbi:hypothetical protein BDW_00915 [Bdellovibrio bacteriovorus W]|nr:hypothetical protein BDW_00915 [Bdellovibrio bacteriovorus W]
MSGTYYIKSGSKNLGPLTEKNVIEALRAGKISLFDLILSNQTQEWVMLMQHPDFSEVLEESGSESVSEDSNYKAVGLIEEELTFDNSAFSGLLSPTKEPLVETVYWYKKNQINQPLKYLDVLSQIHDHHLHEASEISKSPTGPWKKLIDWDEFKPESVSKFRASSPEDVPDVNIRRKHTRHDSGEIFIIIAQNKGFQALCPDISKSGMAFIVRSARCQLNENIMIRFAKELDGNKVDARGEIVSIRKVRIPGSDQVFYRYGVRFTHLTENGKSRLEKL